MERSRILTFASQLFAVLLAGAVIRLYYATAIVNDLLWILAPTRFLVGLVTGVGFTFESYAGYMSSDHSFLIAASCSGVNFLLAAFLMLALSDLWRRRSVGISWNFIPISLAAAYGTTIIANTVRISTAMYIRRTDPHLIWLNPEELHRFEGIVVYFGFLLLLFFVSENFASRMNALPQGRWVRIRRYAVPLAIYYMTTIGIPLTNAALRGGPAAAEFWQHSFFVLFTPLILLSLLALFRISSCRFVDRIRCRLDFNRFFSAKTNDADGT